MSAGNSHETVKTDRARGKPSLSLCHAHEEKRRHPGRSCSLEKGQEGRSSSRLPRSSLSPRALHAFSSSITLQPPCVEGAKEPTTEHGAKSKRRTVSRHLISAPQHQTPAPQVTAHCALERDCPGLSDLNDPIAPLHLRGLAPQMSAHDPRHERSNTPLNVPCGRAKLEGAARTVGTVSVG